PSHYPDGCRVYTIFVSCVASCAVQDPPLLGNDFLSGSVPGDYSDSARNPDLDGQANLGVITGHPRTNRGKSKKPLPFSRSGLKMSDFFLRDCEESAAGGNRFLVTTRL